MRWRVAVGDRDRADGPLRTSRRVGRHLRSRGLNTRTRRGWVRASARPPLDGDTKTSAPASQHFGRDVREVGEQAIDTEVAELFELGLGSAMVAGRKEF